MNYIEYQSPGAPAFHRYLWIGSCEKQADSLPLFENQSASYDTWAAALRSQPLGVQLLVLHYYLLQYHQQQPLPAELATRIVPHMDLLNRFNQRWFEPDYPHFKGLDLNWEDMEASIVSSIDTADGAITEIVLSNGSRIRYQPEERSLQSFYVREDEYEGLVEEWGELQRFWL